MRSRAPVALLASLAACVLVPAAASADDGLAPYQAQVTADEVAVLKDRGFDVGEGGFDSSKSSAQTVEFAATSKQVEQLDKLGIEAEPLPSEKPVAKSAALGDSPNPFFNVYRSYMEPGGIKDEMIALANANPDVMKLEQIGTSTLGKPIYVIKMTADARNVPDGTRHAILFSAVNHAREWIAAEMGRRLPIWFAEHKNDPRIKELLQTRELWFLPIMNVDGYDFTFTCGLGDAQEMCDYRVRTQDDNRFWRKTLRDNNNNGIHGDNQDGVDPNRNYPAKRGIDEEGASNNPSSQTYRGPYALSEPENLAVDRLQRRVRFIANINYHSAGQLLLTPVSYTTDYYPPDSTLFDAITGTDGDEAVFPYRSQHSSDLYESNGDTIDNAYMNYGIIGWTPEMDTCSTMGEPQGCNQFASPDNESKVQAVFNKNLAFALNVVYSLPNMGRPRNFESDPSQYQVKPTQDIQPSYFDVSYGRRQVIQAIVRKELGDADVTVSVVGQGGSVTIPMTPAPAGERYNEVRGYYFERRQAVFEGTIGSRTVQAGDVVNVIVKAGGLQREFRYRIEATQQDETKKRVLVVAAEDYTGKSPNVTAGYDTAPRYLDEHVAALEAAGYEVNVFDIDNPPQNGGSPNPVPHEAIKYPTYLGVMSHFDAVNYYTGDDFAPQDVANTNPRRPTSATAQTGSLEMAPWAHKVMLELREYANNGGKLLIDGRNVHQTFTSTSTSLGATGPYTWTPDKLFGFFYPPDSQGDDDLPGTAWQRSRQVSNDTWQNYLGVVGRQGGSGATGTRWETVPVKPAEGPDALFDGMDPFMVDATADNDPTQGADGTPNPLPKSVLRLRTWGPSNEPLRRETVQADYATDPAQTTNGGAIVSTRDAVTFGFGLEQVSEETRNELVKRSLNYLLPPTPDTTPPTIVGFKYPANLSNATPRDPVEIELTVYDERGDMAYVDLKVGDDLIQRTEVYPFQFRYTPPASAVGSVVKLTAEAVDKAGNKSTRDLYVNVLAGSTPPASPVPVAPPTLLGTPVVGETLGCISGGFLNEPKTLTYAWLRNGAVVPGATSASYTLTSADLGRTIACRITATNDAGSGDATSEALFVVNPASPMTEAPRPTPFAAPAAETRAAATTNGPRYKATCKRTQSRKAISCVVSANSKKAKFKGTIRLQGTRKAQASKASRSGRLKMTVRAKRT
ncbi:MAG TPA: M14 family zinc carboxypeptidase, partial [Solirubrobacter sp.]|nr:M14 family zinc carboxypeptidase [Solirubrobacter sp.]